MTRTTTNLLAVTLCLGQTACTWVDLKPKGQEVRVVSASEIGRCKMIGHVTSNTTASVVYIPRDDDSVNEELERLARNYAGEMGGNAIVPTGPAHDGEQSFNVYHCD